MNAAKALTQIWYRQSRLRFLWYLLWAPIMPLVYAYVLTRRYFYQCHPAAPLPVPVVVVGNISVGGTGKTPFILWLANELSQRGYRVGIVARGYGARLGKDAAHLVGANDDAASVGDEPFLLAQESKAAVAIARDRRAACELLINTGAVEVILSDDGLQHYRMARTLEVVLMDASRALGNRFLLPIGALREPPHRLNSVDFIIGNAANLSVQTATERLNAALHGRTIDAIMQLEGGRLCRMDGSGFGKLSDLAGSKVHAVAAIGNPQRFFDLLQAYGIKIVPHEFIDHHPFSAADFDFGDDLPIIMTQKDAVKCRNIANNKLLYAPVTASLPATLAPLLLQQIFTR